MRTVGRAVGERRVGLPGQEATAVLGGQHGACRPERFEGVNPRAYLNVRAYLSLAPST